jgi:hypothetical protein
MRLKMIDVDFIISDNKACHPPLESCCLALRTHLLLPRYECVLNLLNDAIYHGCESLAEGHHKANVFREKGRNDHVLKGLIEIEFLSDTICKETFHLLSISDAKPQILVDEGFPQRVRGDLILDIEFLDFLVMVKHDLNQHFQIVEKHHSEIHGYRRCRIGWWL